VKSRLSGFGGCDYDTSCGHEDSYEEAKAEQEVQYEYIKALNEVLANENAGWHQALRDDGTRVITVHCAIDVYAQRLTIHIRFRAESASVRRSSISWCYPVLER
jgi:hypothetical protein